MEADSPVNSRPSSGSVVRIILAAVMIQLCLGTVYGWSVFVKPLMAANDWSQTQVTLTFSLAICFLGIGAFLIGPRADRDPRRVAILGGLLFGAGHLLAGCAVGAGSLIPLYLSYGVLGGLGMGLSYLVPISVAIKWVPQRRGFISGVIVMGFGAGAVLTGMAGPWLIGQFGVGRTLMGMGVVFALVCGLAGSLLVNPPSCSPTCHSGAGDALSLRRILGQGKFWALWGMLFFNVSAGIALISQASPMAQNMHHLSEAAAGALVAGIAVFNGLGRVFWSSLSDKVGRRTVFLIMYASQILAFIALPSVPSAWLFTILCSYILLCYGGGFGTMPAFTADLFGSAAVGRVYGPVLTAWSAAGVAGPVLYAILRQQTQGYRLPLYMTAGILVVACVLPLTVGKTSGKRDRDTAASREERPDPVGTVFTGRRRIHRR